jgi:uncharacterized membrane protein
LDVTSRINISAVRKERTMEKLMERGEKKHNKELTLPVIALIAIPGILLLEYFPKYLSRFYEGYTETLMSSIYAIFYVVFAVVIVSIAVLMMGSVIGQVGRTTATFRWKPSMSYLTGENGAIYTRRNKADNKEEKQADRSEE